MREYYIFGIHGKTVFVQNIRHEGCSLHYFAEDIIIKSLTFFICADFITVIFVDLGAQMTQPTKLGKKPTPMSSNVQCLQVLWDGWRLCSGWLNSQTHSYICCYHTLVNSRGFICLVTGNNFHKTGIWTQFFTYCFTTSTQIYR